MEAIDSAAANAKLTNLRPSKELNTCKIGSTFQGSQLMNTAEVFDLEKLQGFKLLDFHKGNAHKEYTTINHFNETETSWSLGLGISSKFDLSTIAIQAKYGLNIAKANLESITTESVFMYYKFDDAYIKLNYGYSNLDKIIASLKPAVANLYWKIVLESNTYSERLNAYNEFISKYGTACITKIDLISYSAAQIEYSDTKKSDKWKNEHEITFGATFQGFGSVSTSANYLHNSSRKNADLNFTATQDTFPVESPTNAWISDLYDKAISKILAKDWAKVTEPTVTPKVPVIPEPPAIKPKDSTDETFDGLNKQFEKLNKDGGNLLGISLYNIAQKEETYAKGDTEKSITAKKDMETAENRVKMDVESIRQKIDPFNVERVKNNDVSVYYLYLKNVLGLNISSTLTDAAKTLLNYMYLEFPKQLSYPIDQFTEKITNEERQNVNTYANLLDTYKKEFNLTKEQIIKCQELYSKTKSSKLLGIELSEVPVSEAQYQDHILFEQMQKDCFTCTTIDAYKSKLRETKAKYYTAKIIEDILIMETSKL